MNVFNARKFRRLHTPTTADAHASDHRPIVHRYRSFSHLSRSHQHPSLISSFIDVSNFPPATTRTPLPVTLSTSKSVDRFLFLCVAFDVHSFTLSATLGLFSSREGQQLSPLTFLMASNYLLKVEASDVPIPTTRRPTQLASQATVRRAKARNSPDRTFPTNSNDPPVSIPHVLAISFALRSTIPANPRPIVNLAPSMHRPSPPSVYEIPLYGPVGRRRTKNYRSPPNPLVPLDLVQPWRSSGPGHEPCSDWSGAVCRLSRYLLFGRRGFPP